ncbi:hypothetical protein GAYE_FCTG49G0070 [Galdieria yellowstonensis]|uniref:Uncharacterized protein n=1 Tax=Galdieria yellowstonensis TaxID=3028027 RepID=A0AAV9I2G3_9RHOD|nr:hypothetical protein GAYE_FCTG49G0070 [Galdieria yellowstonensis]
MENSLTVARRRVLLRKGKHQEEHKTGSVRTATERVESKDSRETPLVESYQSSTSSTCSESSSSILSSETLRQKGSSGRACQEGEESSLDSLSAKLTLDEKKPEKFVKAVAKGLKRPQEPFQWKTSYISIPSSFVPPLSPASTNNQKRSRDFEHNLSNNLVYGEFPPLMRRLCHEHSRMNMRRMKSSSSFEHIKDVRENSCERCQMMTSWMVAIRQAVLTASTLPFDPRYHYVSYSVDRRGIVFCNEPLIRFLPVRNSDQAPRKRARIEVNTRNDR